MFIHQRLSCKALRKLQKWQITELSSSKLLAAAGENSDRVAFTEYIKSNLALHQYRTGLDLSTAGTAAWIRSTVR
jgi:20S proteasome alpha/beta subunit